MRFTKSILSLELEELESDMAIKVSDIEHMPHSKLIAVASVPIKSWLVLHQRERPEGQELETFEEVHELFKQFSIQDIEVFDKLFSIAWDLRTPFMHLQADESMYCMRLEEADRHWLMAEVEKTSSDATIN